MSRPSDRKRRKQKAHQRADAKKKYQAVQQRLYAEKFPGFVYEENGVPPEFVKLVQQAIKKIDFRDPRLFTSREIKLYKLGKRYGGIVILEFLRQTEDDPLTQMAVMCKLGHLAFSKIPQKELRKWIPFHDVQIIPAGRKIQVSFRSLRTAKSPGGTIYYSRFKPTIEIDGRSRIVGFSEHAIERTCERIVPGWEAYTGLGDAFAFFDQCVHFERCRLPNDQLAFTFYDQCRKGFFSWRYVEEVLGWNVEDDGHYYRRIGYCPVVIEGDFIKAKTLLFPGHRNTPEYQFVWASDLSVQEKLDVVNMDAARVQATEDFRLVKFFHQRGVPQVVHDEREFFKPSI